VRVESHTDLDRHPAFLAFRKFVLRGDRILITNPTNPAVRKHFIKFIKAPEDSLRDLVEERRELSRDEVQTLTWLTQSMEYRYIILKSANLDRKFTPQIWMLSLELLYATLLLLVCVVEMATKKIDNNFHKYEAIYFRYVNSCTSVGFVTNALLRMAYSGDLRLRFEGKRWCWGKLPSVEMHPGFFFVSSVVLVTPPMLTHVIPAFFLFFPLPALAAVITGLCVGAAMLIRKKSQRYESRFDSWILLAVNVVLRVIVTFGVTLCVQTLFNYQVLWYHREELSLDWREVWAYEFSGRRWDCLWQQVSADVTHAMQLVSAFV